jgi:hypothetical protein
MREYQLNILKRGRRLSMSMATMQPKASLAIQQAMTMAQGLPFEVWRGENRIHATTDEVLVPRVHSHPAA